MDTHEPDAEAKSPCSHNASDPSVENGTTPGASSSGRTAVELGVPDTLPLTWCANCKADVLPKGKGQCPRCGRVLKQSFLNRRHPVNVLRRTQLVERFTRDYHPGTQRLVSMVEQYAAVVERLETLKPGSTEHQRLVQLSQQLGAALEETRKAQAADPPSAGIRRIVRTIVDGWEGLLTDDRGRSRSRLQRRVREPATHGISNLVSGDFHQCL